MRNMLIDFAIVVPGILAGAALGLVAHILGVI